MKAVPSEHSMIAVVQQDDIASADAAQALNHGRGGLWCPVARRARPHHHRSGAAAEHDLRKLQARENRMAGASSVLAGHWQR